MTDPLVLVNLFTLPPHAVNGFVEGWPVSTAQLAHAPGFRGTRLHRAVSPESRYQIVNIARWDSAEQWQAALTGFQPGGERRRQAESGGMKAEPALYRVVSSAPDPLASLVDAADPLVLMNVLTLCAETADAFVRAWPETVAAQTQAPRFRGARLHRAVAPESAYQLVDIAGWASAEQWLAAVAGWPHGDEQHQPTLYRVVSVTPDPLRVLSGT